MTDEGFRAFADALYAELVDAWNNGFDSGHTEALLAEYDAAVADD